MSESIKVADDLPTIPFTSLTMSFAKKLRRLLLHVAPSTSSDANRRLKGLPGRSPDGYGRRLRDWLAGAEAWFGEPIEVAYIDSPQDHGVDVLVVGLTTLARVGIQIKSDNDLKSTTFQRELKAQVTESLAFQVEQLIVIFACDPYPPNEAKIQHFTMESRRYQAPQLVVLPPERACGLLRAFDTPLAAPADGARGWSYFLDDVGQSSLLGLYVDRWQPLLPEDRFVAPECMQQVQELVATNSITCLVGPPAVGKTFLAAQLAYKHWLSGKPVVWIAPPIHVLTDGPIASPSGIPDARQRVEWLTRELGLARSTPPRDATDFVARNFQPDAFVYIEDPFGKTAAEYTTSLHTYPFFDLDEFLRLLSKQARASARVLITSREGLFDRWRSEQTQSGQPGVGVMRLKSEHYAFKDRLALVERLTSQRGIALEVPIAKQLARQLETPFEVEQCVQSLRNGAGQADVETAADAARDLRLSQAAALVRPDTDAERLFLLCLCTLRRPALGRRDTDATYRMVFDLLGLPGGSAEALTASLAKYSSLVTYSPIMEQPNSPREIEVVHSTVVEAAAAALQATCVPFVNSVARALPRLGTDRFDKYTALRLFAEILSLGIGLQASPEQDAFFELLSHGGDPLTTGNTIVAALGGADARFRELLDAHLCKPTRSVALLLSEINSALRSDTTPADGWRLASAMLRHPTMGATGLRFGHSPWEWAWERGGAMPREFEEGLKIRLSESPAMVIHSMAPSLVRHFKTLPDWLRMAFEEPAVLLNGVAQGRLLLHIGENWEIADIRLRAYFSERACSSDGGVRAAAGTAALIFHEKSPTEFTALLEKLASDPDVLVPLAVLSDGLGDEEHCRLFAQDVLARSDELACADIAASLLYKSGRVAWKTELLTTCQARAGMYGELIAKSWKSDQKSPQEAFGPLRFAPPIVKFAWIWSYANQSSPQDEIPAQELVELLRSLPPFLGLLALGQLGTQSRHLPTSLREHLTENPLFALLVKAANRSEGDELAPGRALWGFPIRTLVEAAQRGDCGHEAWLVASSPSESRANPASAD